MPKAVILVLGCPYNEHSAMPRIEKAVELYRQGKAGKILFSGGGEKNLLEGKPPESKGMARAAIKKGVKRKDILLEETSKSTMENAVNSMKMLREIRPSKVIVVTSDYHSKRAKRVFEKTGFFREFPNTSFEKAHTPQRFREHTRQMYARILKKFRKSNGINLKPKRKPVA